MYVEQYVHACTFLYMYNVLVICVKFIGLASFYAWVRAKHLGCHSVCL